MANTISNNKISHLISSQVPFFVRNDHQTFVDFLEAYYEYLEQDTKVVNRIKNLDSFYDIDRTIDEFAEHLYNTFLKLVSRNVYADKALLLKNIKDFYRARGTEKSVKFLMRILFDEEIDFYYPKKDVLRASDGKWYIEKSLRVLTTKIDDELAPTLTDLEKYLNTRIQGLTSEAEATIERVDRYYENGVQVDELILSNIYGNFESGEQILATFQGIESTQNISSNIISGIVSSVTLTNAGTLYEIGDPVIILSNTGSGACATVAAVTTGNIASLVVIDGGAGYQQNNLILVTGGGGSGANAEVLTVLDDYSVHPNTYNICNSTISVEFDTALNNTQYSNLKGATVSTALEDALYFWVYANTGPISTVGIISAGSGYTSTPTLSVSANSAIQSLGIIGKLDIIDGGSNYAIGDMIYFENILGGYGSGALANVWNVNAAASDAISEVRLIEMPGHIIGGSGYDMNYLPTCNVDSATGSGANVVVSSLLGYGADLTAANTTLGAIQRIVLLSGGTGYSDISGVDLTGSGDGTATADATYLTGVYSYPGRYLNDDGHVSSYNFLQDRDYYQSFSYVVKTKQSIDKYRTYLKTLTHPSGMKMFGEVQNIDAPLTCNTVKEAVQNTISIAVPATLTWSNSNGAFFNPTIYLASHGLEIGNTITLEFTSGNTFNTINTSYTPNGIYRVANVENSDVIEINSGKWLQGSINTRTKYAEGDIRCIAWREDGRKLYTMGVGTDRVTQWYTNTAYDVTTAAYERQGPSVASLENNVMEMHFKPDGTILYVVGSNTDRVIQYNLTEAWNAQTASLHVMSNFDIQVDYGETDVRTFCIGANGSNVYVTGYTKDIIYQFQLSEAWNVNTATYLTEQYVGATSWQPSSMMINEYGNTVFVWNNGNDTLRTYTLGNTWNINLASHIASSVSPALTGSFGSDAQGMKIRPDGKMLYLADPWTTRETIAQIPMPEAWNGASISVQVSSDVTENVIVGRIV